MLSQSLCKTRLLRIREGTLDARRSEGTVDIVSDSVKRARAARTQSHLQQPETPLACAVGVTHELQLVSEPS